MKTFSFSKKGVWDAKLLGIILLILVVGVVIWTQGSKLVGQATSGVSLAKEQQCEGGFGNTLALINCEESNCNDEQQTNWEKYVDYLNDKECIDNKEFKVSLDDNEVGVGKDKACTCVQQEVYDFIKSSGDVNEVNALKGTYTTSVKGISTEDLTKIKEIESSKCKKTQIADLESEFKSEVKKIADKLGSKEEYLYTVMYFETGGTFCSCELNNAGSGAIGLIQFMPSTADDLGTSSLALCEMSRIEQLKYVDNYLTQKKNSYGSLDTLEKLYMAILCPGAITSGYITSKDGSVGSCNGKDAQDTYDKNSGFDKSPKDDKITVAEVSVRINQEYKILGYS